MINSKKKLFKWGPIDSALLPLSYFFETMYEKMFKRFKICWPESVIIFEEDSALWFLEQDSLDKTCKNFTEKIILPDYEREKFNKIWKAKVDGLLKIQNEIDKNNLTNLNDKELADLFKRWNSFYLDFWSVGVTAELINFELDNRLKQIVAGLYDDEKELNKALVILSTPNELSFYKDEELDLMSIVLLDGDDKELALDNHVKKYHWILNNYLKAKFLDKKYFGNQIDGISKKEAQAIIEKAADYQKEAERLKKEYIDKIRLSKENIKIINLLSEAIIYQDLRKKYNLQASYYLEIFLNEISKRRNTEARELKWLLPKEIENYFEGEDFNDLIDERKNIIAVNCSQGHQEIKVKEEAVKIKKIMQGRDVLKETHLQGTVASIGKDRLFKGIARIISSPKEGDRLKSGEILVTPMTTPDFVICMKRAGAIITDIGGVTCHAAVVSREFGIPCIVGTKNASKAIKDGDTIELHNLTGVIKIVNK